MSGLNLNLFSSQVQKFMWNNFFKCSVNFGQASDLYRILNSKIRHNLQGSNLSVSSACFSAKLIKKK